MAVTVNHIKQNGLFQVFQVRKVQGAQTGKIFAMKVLKKVQLLPPKILHTAHLISPLLSVCPAFCLLLCLIQHAAVPVLFTCL